MHFTLKFLIGVNCFFICPMMYKLTIERLHGLVHNLTCISLSISISLSLSLYLFLIVLCVCVCVRACFCTCVCDCEIVILWRNARKLWMRPVMKTVDDPKLWDLRALDFIFFPFLWIELRSLSVKIRFNLFKNVNFSFVIISF
jgi:hypothetical protein